MRAGRFFVGVLVALFVACLPFAALAEEQEGRETPGIRLTEPDAIERIQKMLIVLGYEIGEAGGELGTGTNPAIAAYTERVAPGIKPAPDSIDGAVLEQLIVDYTRLSGQMLDWAREFTPNLDARSIEGLWLSLAAYLERIGYPGVNIEVMGSIDVSVYDAFGKGMANRSAGMQAQSEEFWKTLGRCVKAEEQVKLLMAEPSVEGWAAENGMDQTMTNQLVNAIQAAYLRQSVEVYANLEVLGCRNAAQFTEAYGGEGEGVLTLAMAGRIEQIAGQIDTMLMLDGGEGEPDPIGAYRRCGGEIDPDALAARTAELDEKLTRVVGEKYQSIEDFQRKQGLEATGVWNFQSARSLDGLELKAKHLLTPYADGKTPDSLAAAALFFLALSLVCFGARVALRRRR